MKILFLSLGEFDNLSSGSVHIDIMKKIAKLHDVYLVCKSERRKKRKTELFDECGIHLLRVKTGNIKNVNIIEKGISTLLVEMQYKNAIKKFLKDIKFDLIIYTTPPITFAGVISYIKKRDSAKSYLLLKDIFPQNAVDIGMMTKSGPKSIIYKMFRKKEEKLYKLSDFIGCMSQANVDYLIENNPYVDPRKVHINPNSIEVAKVLISDEKKVEIKDKYNIPKDATTFIYGGNLGRPQGIPFIIECLKANADKPDRFFVICGDGTEFPKLKAYVESEKPDNVLLINKLPKEEYEEFVKAFDIGLIFLDHRFTIPNFPSRLLSYMQSSMPVLACTDPNTDIGKVITEGGFGWWCESNSVEQFTQTVDNAIKFDIKSMGEKGFEFLEENYTSQKSCDIILKHIK